MRQKVTAGSGNLSEATTTAALPLRITGAVNETKDNSAGSSGARTTITPLGSGVVKLKWELATGFTLPNICEYLSVQPAK